MAGSDGLHVLEGTFLSNVQNFRHTLLSVNDGVYLTDTERRIIFWNRACQKITGYSPGEVLGRRCSDNILCHVDLDGNRLCESDLCPLYRSIVTGQPGKGPLTVRALRRDRSRISVEVSVAPLFGEDGSVIGGVEVFRDVTEKQELAELKARFLSGISHELKGPLTIIQGFIELILAGDAGETSPTQREFLTSAMNEGNRFKKILDDLSDLARFEATEFSFSMEKVDLSSLLEELAASQTGEAARKGLRLNTEIPGGITVLADWGRLYQAFANLLANALKYTEKGAVSLTADSGEGLVRVTVADSGIGIEEKNRERIFDLFYRADNQLTKKVAGTGIGLSIVKKIIDRHGGTIAVESYPGRGSAFKVTLPGRTTNLT